jgi:methionyl aminopeptidase
MIFLKTTEQIDIMHEANLIVHAVLDEAENNIEAGMTTQELNDIMENKMSEFSGATSAFRGYKDYPDVSCISVNEEVVHGIPSEKMILPGDIVSVDFGVYYNGMAGDSARTFIVGDVEPEVRDLVSITRQGLWAGIRQMVPGNKLHDIGEAIDAVARQHNFGNVRGFCGHGIGAKMHELPHVFNYVEPLEPNVRLRAGMVFALEPMFNLGHAEVLILEDGWTIITKDKKKSCHWELSIAVTENGPRVLGNAEAYKTDI